MSPENISPVITDKIWEAREFYHSKNTGDLFTDLLVRAYEEDLSEEQIAYCSLWLLEEAREESEVGVYNNRFAGVYKLALEALIETGNLHTETYQQFFQQYNNFIALSLQPR